MKQVIEVVSIIKDENKKEIVSELKSLETIQAVLKKLGVSVDYSFTIVLDAEHQLIDRFEIDTP